MHTATVRNWKRSTVDVKGTDVQSDSQKISWWGSFRGQLFLQIATQASFVDCSTWLPFDKPHYKEYNAKRKDNHPPVLLYSPIGSSQAALALHAHWHQTFWDSAQNYSFWNPSA